MKSSRSRETVEEQSRKSALNAESTPRKYIEAEKKQREPRKYPIPHKLELQAVPVPLVSLHTVCISSL